MGKSILIASIVAVLMAAVAFAQSHPVEMGNMDCIACHSDKDTVEKPNVVSEWQKSIHSYTGVACGSCHGDEEDFAPRPRKEACEPCHTAEVAKVSDSALPCERCHVAHTFNVHGN